VKYILFALACLLAVGCGGKNAPRATYPVSGSVEYNGQIPVGGMVVLNPVSKPDDGKQFFTPRGTVNSDGTFKLWTYELDDGAPAGDYIVTFSWHGNVTDEDLQNAQTELMPMKYRKPETSDIKVTITDGENQLEKFVLTGQ
jgi:hypothetical protein